MGTYRYEKWLAVGIILLFVGTCVIPAMAKNIEKPLIASRGKWLYVGGSGPGNYSKIQDAVDNASDGDTVFVYDESSPYNGSIMVNKSIQVIGEDKNTTILLGIGLHDYDFSSIVITTDRVNLSGFTVQQQTGLYGIWIKGNESKISDSIIDDYWFGIYIYPGLIDKDSTKNIVYNNLIKNCFIGLSVYRSSHTIIAHNSINNCISDNRWGGGISIVHGDNTVISNNDIRLDGGGIWVEDSENVSIFLNNVTKNAIGISTSSTNNIKITQNNIYRNRVKNIVFYEYPHQNMEVNNNYWGMRGLHQKIVFGQLLIYLFTLKLSKISPYWIDIPIYLPLPKTYIDKNTAQEPYEIPGMR